MPVSTSTFLRRALCALIALSGATLARATDRRVPSQYPTIGAAVSASAVNDRVLVANGTYAGPGNRNILLPSYNIVVQSESDDPASCIIDCQQLGKAFYILSGHTSATLIRGFTIRNGMSDYGGAIYNIAGSIVRCNFIGNKASNYGGGLVNDSGSVTNCTFTGNQSSNAGGGVFNTRGFVTNCTFTGNTARTWGGGISDSNGVITGCIFQQNTAASGAGMSVQTGTRVVGSAFIANSAVLDANGWVGSGAIAPLGGDHTEINCTFIRNTGSVGAIYNGSNSSGAGTQINCSFYGNKANAYANAANNKGGAIFNDQGGKQVNCIIYGNTATGGGGEIYNNGAGSVQNSCLIGGLPSIRDVYGNFGANPLFVNAAGDDLHLSPGSPAIESGSDYTSPNISTDFDGFPRITGPHRDIGAYELHSSIYVYLPGGAAVNASQVGIGLANAGRFAENNVKITSATLGGYPALSPLPQNLGTIGAGANLTTYISFPRAFPYASYQLLTVKGSSNLGTFSYSNWVIVF